MPETLLDHVALESYMPHRGPNLLPDSLTISEDGQRALSRTRVDPDDPRGRDIFSRDAADGGRVWLEPFIGELMALTGIPLLKAKLDAAGQVAVFSAVSRIVFGAEAPLGAELEGHAVITRDRGAFTQFTAELQCAGELVYKAEIMSGQAAMADVAGQPVQAPDWDAAEPLQADFGFKAPAMRFIDGVRSWDPDAGRMVGVHTYPEGHPLVPGHFPGAALMMGMCQWTAIADAAWEARARSGHRGAMKVAGAITRPGGDQVLEVRDMVLSDAGGIPRFTGARRLAFREPIRPGDGIVITVDVQPC
ncbi:MAG: hypothetical protein ACOC02_07175 [Guyparkeria sp.]